MDTMDTMDIDHLISITKSFTCNNCDCRICVLGDRVMPKKCPKCFKQNTFKQVSSS